MLLCQSLILNGDFENDFLDFLTAVVYAGAVSIGGSKECECAFAECNGAGIFVVFKKLNILCVAGAAGAVIKGAYLNIFRAAYGKLQIVIIAVSLRKAALAGCVFAYPCLDSAVKLNGTAGEIYKVGVLYESINYLECFAGAEIEAEVFNFVKYHGFTSFRFIDQGGFFLL